MSFAKAVHAAGADALVLAARRADRLQKLQDELTKSSSAAGKVFCVQMDVSDSENIATCFEEIDTALMGNACNVVINNAGMSGKIKPLIDADDFEQVIQTNLQGPLTVIQQSARRLIAKEEKGSIINIGSILGTQPSLGIASYCISKAGLEQLTKTSAAELLRHGIRVNTIAPGYIETEINSDFFASPKGQAFLEKRIMGKRLGKPSDLDGPLLLLCSDQSEFMTGTTLTVDGGSLLFPM